MLADPKTTLRELDRLDSEESLAGFVRCAWSILEPGAPYIHGWHIDAMCEHLEAVTAGQITRLLINVPPGAMKSLLVGVLWPSWEWGPRNLPHHRFVATAHKEPLAIRDNLKARRLVSSDWYQSLWGNRVILTGDQNAKTKFENTKTGFREAMAFNSLTGSRGDRVLCFPHNEIVHTEHGPMKIGEIVKSKKPIRVWSSKPGSGKIELKSVFDWKHNPGSKLVEVGLSDGTTFTCTPDHKIWTSGGWLPAGSLTPSHSIPCQAIPYGPDSARANAILGGQSALGFGRVADGQRIVSGKFGPTGAVPSPIVAAFQLIRRKFAPCFSAPNLLNNPTLNAKPFTQNVGCLVAGGNDGRLISGQFSSGSILIKRERSVPFGVGDVLCSGSVCKIAEPCIAAVPVFVANFMSIRGRPDERKHNSLVHKHLGGHSAKVGVKARISFVRWRFQNLFWNGQGSASRAGHNPSFAADPAQIAHAIQSLKAGERFPIFVREAGHADETFCLSVEDNHSFFVGSGKGVLVSNCDDPHSVDDAASEQKRETAVTTFLEAVPTRLNNPAKSAIVVIMQRLHEQDVSGVILSRKLGYEHLMLPMEFEASRRCRTSIGFTDPRTTDGELLFPARFPREVVDRDKRVMGEYASAGQFQQRPAPRGGAIFKTEYVKRYAGDPPNIQWRAIFADTAMKAKEENDYSSFQEWGLGTDGRPYFLAHVRGKWEAPELETVARSFWKQAFSRPVVTHGQLRFMAVEDKVSGTGLIQKLRREHIPVVGIQRDKDKVQRAHDVTPYLAVNPIMLAADATWGSAYLDELLGFPRAANDDQVDPTVDAIKSLLANSFTYEAWT